MTSFNSTTTGIVLSKLAQNPATITAGSAVTNTTSNYTGDAVYGGSSITWTITNNGTVNATYPGSAGVYINDGGEVTNEAVGSIVGKMRGISISNAVGTVVNLGMVGSTSTTAGNSGAAVYLGYGGIVNNQSGGLLTAYLTGVNIFNNPGTVTNAGSIVSTSTKIVDSGIFIGQGGVVTNSGFIGSGWTGIGFGTADPGTVANLGTIVSTADFLSDGFHAIGVILADGGLVTNGSNSAPGALIQGYEEGVYLGGVNGVTSPGALGTLVNYGTVASTATGTLAAAAVFLEGFNTVTNHGTIVSNQGDAVFTRGNVAGGIANFGLIESFATSVATIYSSAGGSVTNAVGGQIVSQNRNAIAFNDKGGAPSVGTVTNAGVIESNATGTTGSAVYLGQGGLLTNQSSGSIAGPTGVTIGAAATGDSTIVNSGTIDGANGLAIQLGIDSTEIVIESGSQLGGAIGNFQPNDSIDLPFLSFTGTGGVSLQPGNVLQVNEDSTTFDVDLNPNQSFIGNNFHLQSDGGSGTLITMGSDVLWNDGANGDTGYWVTSSSGSVTGFANFGDGATGYAIAGVGEFDSSGTPEILWHNSASGDTGYWTLNSSGAVTGFDDLGPGNAAYNIVGIGDFDDSGHDEVLWQDPTTNDVGFWTTNSSGSVTGFDNLGTGASAYSLVGVGDFDDSGHDEVLWEDPTTNDVGFWTTNSSGAVTGFHNLGAGASAYSLVGIGDFDGLGRDELLWEDKATGETGYWTSNASGAVTGFHDLGNGDTAYSVAGVGDYDGSGHDEVLWEDAATGDTGYWTTNAVGAVTGFHDLGPGDTSYHIVAT